MQELPRYARWHCEFPADSGVERVEFTGPDRAMQTRPTFQHQPARLEYDVHGYETTTPQGEPVVAVRWTPTAVSDYRYRALAGKRVVAEGALRCVPSEHPGYVQRSARDPRYFAYSDGNAYVPIGPCLVGPPHYPLPRSREHFDTGAQTATLGCAEYRRWFRLLAAHGANFCRIWLSNAEFEVEGQVAGDLNLAAFARVDRLVELARASGIRLKLCFEHWRTFEPGTFFARALRHPDDGRAPASVDEWLQSPVWRALWLKKVHAYLARYGGDPTVMAWELWNEINCLRTSNWPVVNDWTRDMLAEIKRLEPSQLVVNSLGSFD
ncbi:MAG: cellulase family glycosylhydrolase, partial [Chloroflexota bacterium]